MRLGATATASSPPPAAIRLTVWVEWPVVPLGQSQTIYVQVVTPDGRGVEHLQIRLEVNTGAKNSTLELPPTDADGQTRATYASVGQPGEFVWYEASVDAGGQTLAVRDRFLVWYGPRHRPAADD